MLPQLQQPQLTNLNYMENQTTNIPPVGVPMNTPIPPQMPEKASMSGVIGTIIIIALIILGGLYFWGKRINTQKETAALVEQEQMASQQAAAIEAVSSSDELDTLRAEVEATQTTNLGAELQ